MDTVLPWYIAGPLIGAIVPILLVLTGKSFGISSSYRYTWSRIFSQIPYFNYAREKDVWQVQFAVGLVLAGGVFPLVFDWWEPSYATLPVTKSWHHWAQQMYQPENALLFLFGGIFVGFGARFANGCTAGHCIMGLAQTAKSSLVATIGFFLGGLIAAHVLIPFIFNSLLP